MCIRHIRRICFTFNSYYNHTFSTQISVDHNIYKEVTCFERHQLVPFSNHQSGAVTQATIHLALTSERSYDATAQREEATEITTRSPLLFNHLPTVKPTHGEIRTSRELLTRMCSIGFPVIKRDFIEVFTKFLQTTRQLSHTALHQLLNRADSICSDSQNGKYVLSECVGRLAYLVYALCNPRKESGL